jgi:hypothetical protein
MILEKDKISLALKLSKYVHDNCKDVPHDIGLHLVQIVEEYNK